MTIHDSCTVLRGSTFGAPWRASSACNAFSPSWWSPPRSSWRSHKIVLSPAMSSTCWYLLFAHISQTRNSRNCMKSPAWKGGGHAWHCQLPGGWTGSTRSIGWNCSRCTLRGYSHPDTLVITFHVRLASAGDIVFNLPEEIIGNPDRSCTLLLNHPIWNAKQLESEPPVYPALIFSGSLELACLSISISGQARNS